MSRILIITKNYPPAICGVGDHSFYLKQQWEQMGHEVSVLTCSVSQLPDVINLSSTGFSGSIFPEIKKIVRKFQIDTLFWQYVPYSYQEKGIPFWWPKLMRVLARDSNLKQLIYFHEVSLRLSGDGFRQSVLAFFQQKIARAANRLADAGYTSIPLYQSYFQSKKPAIVPVGSNLPLGPNDDIGVPGTPGRIVCFANRADRALIEAVADIRKDDSMVELWLIGSISEDQTVRIINWAVGQANQQWLHVTGLLPPYQLSDLISSAAIFFQPQVTDKSGRGGISAKNGTIMAAMQRGRAIISCKGDMTDPELFRNRENIVFVPYGDMPSYKLAIRDLLINNALRASLGKAASELFQNMANWSNIACKLADAFKKQSSNIPA